MVTFPLPLSEAKGDFLRSSLWESDRAPRGKAYKNVGASLLLGPPEVFNSHTCLQRASSSSSITPQVFLPWHWLWQGLLP